MKYPKISVLIPAFNEEKMLEEAVKSTLKSKYPNKEIIVGIDDGTDRTLEISKKLKKKYKNFSYVYHPKRVGTTTNMNSILKKSKGFSFSTLGGKPMDCKYLRMPSSNNRSKARELFPEPDTPVIATILFFGIFTLMFFKL